MEEGMSHSYAAYPPYQLTLYKTWKTCTYPCFPGRTGWCGSLVLTRFELGEDGSTLTDMTQCTSSPQVSRVPLGLSQPAWNDEGILPFSSQIFEPKQRRWQSRERSCSIEARLVTREV